MTENDKKINLSKKKLIKIIVVLVIITGLIFAIYYESYGDINYNSVYNSTLGISISIGMKKERVDKLLDNPLVNSYGYYTYDKGNLWITYEHGRVKRISVVGGRWRVEGRPGVGYGSDKEMWLMIAERDEKMEYNEELDYISFYVTRRRIVSRDNHKYSISIFFRDNKVGHIIIS